MKDTLNKKYEPIHYKHTVKLYVPVFQKNPVNDNDSSPYFTYSYTDANEDINMVLQMKPDYVLVLTGDFDAITQPFDLNLVRHNNKQWIDENF